MAKNNANLPDLGSLVAAGINPKTKMPLKFGGSKSSLEPDIKKLIRVKDEQEAVNRFNWYNTGLTISSNMLERFLYYKYKLGFFYFNNAFWVMPVTLSGTGTLDFYNLENEVTPVPYNDSASKEQRAVLSNIKLKVVKEPLLNPTLEDFEKSCVIIKDYTPQGDINNGIPRSMLQDGIISLESIILPYMRTNLLNNTGVMGVKISDVQEEADVKSAANEIDECAKNGIPWVALLQKLDRQPLSSGTAGDSSTYLQAYQSIDNLRQSFLGVSKSGIYDKSQYVNKSQTALNTPVDFALTDGLKLRQNACDIINSIWDLGIWCEASETALETDINGDMISDDSEKRGTQYEPDTQDQSADLA